jgi:hypothetical protein
MIRLFLSLICLLAMSPAAHAGAAKVGEGIQIEMRNPEGSKLLRDSLNKDGFWTDAWSKEYSDKWYDEVRLKPTDGGYLPFITGEGERDYDHDTVSHTVFKRMHELEQHMDGAKRVVHLGSGVDPKNGLPYTDVYMYLDLTIFYGVFAQRMYKLEVSPDMTVLFFEKMDSSYVDTATWAGYQKKIDEAHDGVNRRWPPFNSIIEVSEVYGMFIVTPGDVKTSRVTFVSKLTFGQDTSWVARWGSQMPMVLKSGLKSGYNACVEIATEEQIKRTGG